ncbi:replicative DNA helicase [Litorihabitans aurantiacus]|uniref:DNA 5'-3' helicase n=1 Tax=Litorihabitans aurantiacus TaxID=1930061 RepID=A0AA38CWP4_9MICO|nr:DnaB-like helicase C-terminal domain-containing protein [Litorihabitans aurantiacus]GMA33522.1 replicative DNA helicase [Litorihabitans aurantiacus]GMA33625.1 replicative DNA helicase [Litorihabitans aurantiacus]
MTDLLDPSALDRAVIHDPHAEKVLLGLCMTRGRRVAHDLTLNPADFYTPAHEQLYGLIQRLAGEGKPTDLATINANLASVDQIHRGLITAPLLIECEEVALGADGSVAYYSRLVADYATRRHLSTAAVKISQLARGEGEVGELVEMARGLIDGTRSSIVSDIVLLGDDYDEFVAGLDRETRTVPTPWPGLTKIISGWAPGGLYVIAARPSIGKTIVGLQVALWLTRHGYVSFTSLEMTRRELQQRATAYIAQVQLGALKGRSPWNPELTVVDRERIAENTDTMKALRLAVNDSPGATVNSIRSHARSVSRLGKLSAVVVDYLGLLSATPGDRRSRYEMVTEWSRHLKTLAMEMQVPVIVLAQLNRGSTQRADGRPQLSDLRDSGSVEQDADVVMLLHAEDPADRNVDMGIAKNRQGVLGRVEFTKRGETAEFAERHAMPNDGWG